ncbi:LysR family transcriptional regulator [Kribbella antibiotica]|uniref:LysR family transcriptional regulator n=1 Tax=Kribbella antibiotica TaxID=190195 RepID=A0A4R4ZUM1_9ACTN|nr:LysR family transcriptional regulator [Kribbella antibiotica]TDD62858.1 LysR family transcriptional regulator [Kribbella antibiotica]
MVDVELRHLVTMAAIVEEGTFGRAAARLGYTQSTISQQVAGLERSVGGALFERPGGPRPVRLTPLGSVVLEQGRELLAKADALSDAIDRFKAGGGRIDIGTFQSVSHVILPPLIGRLRAEQPGCEIKLIDMPAETPQIGDLDLLFYDRPLDDGVEQLRLVDDPYLLVARPGDLPAGPVALTALDGRPMIGCHETCDQVWMEPAVAAGARPEIAFRTPGNETILSMVRAGLGWTALPWLALYGADARSDKRLALHPLEPAPTRGIYLHWPANAAQSPLAVRAIEISREIAAEVSASWAAAAGR